MPILIPEKPPNFNNSDAESAVFKSLRGLRDEMVAGLALRMSLPEFLASNSQTVPLVKFILERVDTGRAEGLRLTG